MAMLLAQPLLPGVRESPGTSTTDWWPRHWHNVTCLLGNCCQLSSGPCSLGFVVHQEQSIYTYLVIPPPNEVGGGVYWIHLVRPSVRLSVDDMVSGA